jgi:aminoglycoside phosphotransferase (APT) family kinase protein
MDIPRLDGFPDTAAIVERYEAASGHTISDLDYWERFNAVRVALILMRMGRLMIAAELLPPDAAMPTSNPATKLLARLLDLPESGLAVQDWSGVRA